MTTNLLKIMFTKVRYKPRITTNFNQKVKMLKTSNFRYDTSVKKLLKNIAPTFEQVFVCWIYFNSVYKNNAC